MAQFDAHLGEAAPSFGLLSSMRLYRGRASSRPQLQLLLFFGDCAPPPHNPLLLHPLPHPSEHVGREQEPEAGLSIHLLYSLLQRALNKLLFSRASCRLCTLWLPK